SACATDRSSIRHRAWHVTCGNTTSSGTERHSRLYCSVILGWNEVAVVIQPRSPGATTIMLVEDDHAVAQTLTDALESSGYRVWVAETGADSKTLLEQTRPDLIILDLMLPDVDGLVLRSRLMAIADVPLVICIATPQK